MCPNSNGAGSACRSVDGVRFVRTSSKSRNRLCGPMTPEHLFYVANILPLPIWLIWLLAPRSRPSRALARSTWPWAVIGGFYAVLLGVGLFTGDLAAAGLEGQSFQVDR